MELPNRSGAFDAHLPNTGDEFYATLEKLFDTGSNEDVDKVGRIVELAEQTWRLYHPDNHEAFQNKYPKLAEALENISEKSAQLDSANRIDSVADIDVSGLLLELTLLKQHWSEVAQDDAPLRENTASEARKIMRGIQTHANNIDAFTPDQATRIEKIQAFILRTDTPSVDEIHEALQQWYEFLAKLENPGLEMEMLH